MSSLYNKIPDSTSNSSKRIAEEDQNSSRNILKEKHMSITVLSSMKQQRVVAAMFLLVSLVLLVFMSVYLTFQNEELIEDINELLAEVNEAQDKMEELHDPRYRASNGHYFRLTEKTLSYQVAERVCLREHGMLAAAGMRNVTIRKEVMQNYIKIYALDHVWIGLDDLINEGKFVYVDGVESNKNNTLWGENEPNGNARENCAGIYINKNYKLNDFPCSNEYKALCEIEK